MLYLNNLDVVKAKSVIVEVLGLDQSTYARYERGEIPLNEIYIRILTDFYEVSISYLMNDTNKEIILTKEQYKNLLLASETIEDIKKNYEKTIKIENNYGVINFNEVKKDD